MPLPSDVQIEGATDENIGRNVFAISHDVLYAFVQGGGGVEVKKSTDGGLTWPQVAVMDANSPTSVEACDIWWQGKNVANRDVTQFHVVQCMNTAGSDDFEYALFDTATDTFGTVVTVASIGANWESGYITNSGFDEGSWAMVCMAEGGRLKAWYGDADEGRAGFESDDGVIWTSDFDYNGIERGWMLPNRHSPDPQDLYVAKRFTNTDRLDINVIDDSTDTINPSNTLTSALAGMSQAQLRCIADIDPATGDIVIVHTEGGGLGSISTTAAIRMTIWDGSVEIDRGRILPSGVTRSACVGLQCLSGTDWRVYVQRGAAGSGQLFIHQSTDRGLTWDAGTAFSVTTTYADADVIAAVQVSGIDGTAWAGAGWQEEGSNVFRFNGDPVEGAPSGGAAGVGIPERPPRDADCMDDCFFGFEFDEIHDPAGNIFRMSDGIKRHLMFETGTGIPPVDYVAQRSPFQHGETLTDYFLRPRVVQQRYRWPAKHRYEWWCFRTFLIDAVRPNRQLAPLSVVEPLTLRKYLPDGARWDLKVMIESGPVFSQRQAPGWDEWTVDDVLRWIAHDPVYFDPDETEFILDEDEDQLTFDDDEHLFTGGADFEPGERIYFGGALSGTLPYAGNWLSYPLVQITGPVTGPALTNDASQEMIRLDYTVATGEVVEIDLSPGRKTVVSLTNGNLIGNVTEDSNLATWAIVPDPTAPLGRNDIRLFGGDIDVGQGSKVRLVYHTRKIGLGA